MNKKIPQCETGAQVVNKNHGETFPRKNTGWEEEEMCCVFKSSRPVKKNSGGVLTKVGLCIEGCFSRYNTRLNYEEYTKCN